MGWLDILKGILPDALAKVDNRRIDNRKIDNRKIIITGSAVSYGNQTITDQKVIDKIFGEIEQFKNKETLPFQLVHKDLQESYLQYEDLSIKHREGIKKLKLVLSEEDIECILMARRVLLAFEKDNEDLAKNLQSQLEKNYPKKGLRVFNLIGGGYFDELIMPLVDVFPKEDFVEFYKGIINFFPLAIFVGNTTTEEILEKELIYRLKLSNIPFVRLHAYSRSNIDKVEKVVEKLGIEHRYVVKDNRFTLPNGLKAQIYEIKLQKRDIENR